MKPLIAAMQAKVEKYRQPKKSQAGCLRGDAQDYVFSGLDDQIAKINQRLSEDKAFWHE